MMARTVYESTFLSWIDFLNSFLGLIHKPVIRHFENKILTTVLIRYNSHVWAHTPSKKGWQFSCRFWVKLEKKVDKLIFFYASERTKAWRLKNKIWCAFALSYRPIYVTTKIHKSSNNQSNSRCTWFGLFLCKIRKDRPQHEAKPLRSTYTVHVGPIFFTGFPKTEYTILFMPIVIVPNTNKKSHQALKHARVPN